MWYDNLKIKIDTQCFILIVKRILLERNGKVKRKMNVVEEAGRRSIIEIWFMV